MRKLIIMAAAAAIVGCSAPQVKPVEISSIEPVAQSCKEKIIGTSPLQQWCEAVPNASGSCDCADGTANKAADVAIRLANVGLSPSDLHSWYEVLPADFAFTRAADWMLTGIPKNDVASWIDLSLPPAETKAIYNLGQPVNSAKAMIAMGLRVNEMGDWLATGIPMQFWSLWLGDKIPPATAKNATEINKLTTVAAIKRYLIDRSFQPVDESTPAGSWICSKSNNIAQLTLVAGARVDYIQRFDLIDPNGYPLIDMSLFSKDINLDKYRIVRKIVRGTDGRFNWATCPVGIEGALP